MVSSAALGRVAVLLMIALQSPFMVTKTGAGVAPIHVITKYALEAAKKDGGELSDQTRTALRALNWPAHMFEECVIRRAAGLEGNCDATFVWERAVSHASKVLSFWDGLNEQGRQVLFAGSATLAFGSLISFFSGRTHLLSVLGSGMLGYGIYLNSLTPTFQFIVAVLIAIVGLQTRAKLAIPAGPTPMAAKPAAPPAAAAKAGAKKSN